ncbi:MAG: radical SAM protein [Nitrospirae bacterium]|nr:radical SAM protein [Nitrospirota bacterium]
MMRISGFDDYFYLQWHITNSCNLSCTHCYVQESKPQLDRGAFLSILDKYDEFLKRRGLKGRIQFTGGEPLMSEDLYVLADEARKKAMPVRILSNGTLVTREKAKMLREAGCTIAQVSIDGDKDTHNAIRGDFAYEKAMEGARVLKEEGLSVTIMMTISGMNYTSMKTVYGEVSAGVADRFSISRVVPIGRGASYRDDTLSKGQLKGLFKTCLALKSENSIEMPMRDPLWGPYFRRLNPRLLSGCSIGYNGICIDSDGTVYPCRRLPVSIGNILDDEFDDIYNGETLNHLRNRDTLNGKCKRCRYRWQCGGCRAVAYAISGDYSGEDPQCFI